jgi:hypothetical protein
MVGLVFGLGIFIMAKQLYKVLEALLPLVGAAASTTRSTRPWPPHSFQPS